MTSQAFEAVLDEPDNDATHLRLYELVATRNYCGESLPIVAARYLQAFCDSSSSSIRRRWIGIALAGMVDVSLVVAQHLAKLAQELQDLGAMILSNTESEELKIIAGIVIRQCLEQGIKYASFWASDKFKNSAPEFPEHRGPRWMPDFQHFLDALCDLALVSPNTDPSIIYPISLVASDGFRWRESHDGLPIALIQAGILTFIGPDEFLRDFQFVDIPINHIHSMRSQPSNLHDSQARSTTHDAWDLVLLLKAEPWSYLLNTTRRAGNELTLLFHHSVDAREWEESIKEKQDIQNDAIVAPSSRVRIMMSSSSPINIDPSVPSPGRESLAQHEEIQSCTEYAHLIRSHHSPPHSVQHMPSPSQLPQDLSMIESTPKRIEVTTGQADDYIQSQHAKSTNTPAEQLNVSKKTLTPKEASKGKDELQTAEAQRNSELSQSTTTSEGRGTHTSTEANYGVLSQEQAVSSCPTSNQRISGKGRLPKVSRAAKLKAFKQLPVKSSLRGLPKKSSGRPKARKGGANAENASISAPVSTKQQPGSKTTHVVTSSGAKSTGSHRKRKADDDEEFVPEDRKPGRKIKRMRKPVSNFASSNEILEKKPVVGQRKVKTMFQYAASAVLAQEQKVKTPQLYNNPSLPVDSSRHPLIGGLLSSQRQSGLSAIRPRDQNRNPQELQSHTSKPASTPTRLVHQSIQQLQQPQTPQGVHRCPNETHLPSNSSSFHVNKADIEGHHRKPRATPNMMILSSNSKPLPASPHAESRAISGLAYRDHIDTEKTKGEQQTAKSDPFKQHGKFQNPTPFMRRLTGDSPMNEIFIPTCGPPHSVGGENSPSSEVDIMDVAIITPSQPLPSHVPRQYKVYTPIKFSKCSEQLPSHVPRQYKVYTPIKFSKCSEQQPSQTLSMQETEINITANNKVSEQPPMGSYSRHNISESPVLQSTKWIATEENQRGIKDGRILVAKVNPMNPDPTKIGIEYKEEHRYFDLRDAKPGNRFQPLHITRKTHLNQGPNHMHLEGDTTLTMDDKNKLHAFNIQTPSIQFRSSPPIRGSSSCEGSTSAESDTSSPLPLPTSEAEELEWEASLQPHQRALHDLLIRTSKRVLRYIVDNETAVTDIVEIFARDGDHVLKSLIQRQEREYSDFFPAMESKTRHLKKELEHALRRVAKDRRHVNSMN